MQRRELSRRIKKVNALQELSLKKEIWERKNGKCLIIIDSLTNEELNVDFEAVNQPFLQVCVEELEEQIIPRRVTRYDILEERENTMLSQLMSGQKVRL